MYKRVFTERRLYNRFPTSMVGSYDTSEAISGNLICKDISTGGLSFVSSDPVSIGNNIKLNLSNRDGDIMNINGNIRWCKKVAEGWKTGIRFKNPLFMPLDKVL